jgi:ABC-type nitrate/sulfonate/bicarbonate transport system substrate-binding protein
VVAAQAQPIKLNVAYTSTTTNFSIAWVAKVEGLFRKHNLDVELILMQGPSTYLPALLSGNINILYGGGHGGIACHHCNSNRDSKGSKKLRC